MAVDVVAVDVNPTVWQAFCNDCDKYVSDTFTQDEGEKAVKVGLVHWAQFHPEAAKAF